MAQRDGLHLGVLEQLVPVHVFELVAHARQREVLARRALGATLEPDHVEAGLGQFARQDAAGPADADHDRIDLFQERCHGWSLPARPLLLLLHLLGDELKLAAASSLAPKGEGVNAVPANNIAAHEKSAMERGGLSYF